MWIGYEWVILVDSGLRWTVGVMMVRVGFRCSWRFIASVSASCPWRHSSTASLITQNTADRSVSRRPRRADPGLSIATCTVSIIPTSFTDARSALYGCTRNAGQNYADNTVETRCQQSTEIFVIVFQSRVKLQCRNKLNEIANGTLVICCISYSSGTPECGLYWPWLSNT